MGIDCVRRVEIESLAEILEHGPFIRRTKRLVVYFFVEIEVFVSPLAKIYQVRHPVDAGFHVIRVNLVSLEEVFQVISTPNTLLAHILVFVFFEAANLRSRSNAYARDITTFGALYGRLEDYLLFRTIFQISSVHFVGKSLVFSHERVCLVKNSKALLVGHVRNP